MESIWFILKRRRRCAAVSTLASGRLWGAMSLKNVGRTWIMTAVVAVLASLANTTALAQSPLSGHVVAPSDSFNYEFQIYTVPTNVSAATITATATWAPDWYLPPPIQHTQSVPNLVVVPYLGGFGCDFLYNYPQNDFVQLGGMDPTNPNATKTASITVGPGKTVAIAGSDCFFSDNFTFHTLVNWIVELGGGPLSVTTTSLQGGMVGSAYNQVLLAAGGTPPYTWSIPSGALPDGLALAGPAIAGTPTVQGTFNFAVQVTDSVGTTAMQPLSIDVGPPPPTNLEANQERDATACNGVAGGQIKLKWDYPSSATIDGFKIERVTPSSLGLFSSPALTGSELTVQANSSNCLSGKCTFCDSSFATVDGTNFIQYATYAYRLRAFIANDESATSNVALAPQVKVFRIQQGVIEATFTPDLDAVSPPLDTVAHLLNYDHFNWVQFVRWLPCEPPALTCPSSQRLTWPGLDGNDWSAPPDFVDPPMGPPLGGWNYIDPITRMPAPHPADDLPFYYSEPPGDYQFSAG